VGAPDDEEDVMERSDDRLPLSVVPAADADGARREGPPLEVLLRRLADAPADLLDPRVDVPAALADLTVVLDGTIAPPDGLAWLDGFAAVPGDDRRAVALLVGWMLADPAVHADPGLRSSYAAGGGAGRVMLWAAAATADELAGLRAPADWVRDDAAREELVRAACAVLGVRPAGSTEATAADAWRAVSTRHRRRVVAEMEQERMRAEELAKKLADKRAREAAAQYANY
jgi:hypothetical protein